MKGFQQVKRIALLSCLLAAAVSTGIFAYEVKGGEVKTASSVNLRSEANTGSAVITRLADGDRVAVLDETNGWYQVAYNGATGYMSADFVELNDVMNVTPGGAKITTDVLNVRSSPSTSAEIVSRLSKGDIVKIIGINSGWFKIETSSYKGYIHPDYATVVEYAVSGTAASASGRASVSSDYTPSAGSSLRQQIVEYAETFLGVPYVYGGASPKGFDCSGFVQYVYAHFNISLPHSSATQYKSYVTKISRDNLNIGDLVFFTNGGSGVGHVGIYVGGGNFIHAPSPGKSVCYDSLDSKYYSSHYIGSGTVF